MDKIRLACMFCDRNDYDGVSALPPDWFSVDEVQTYEESLREAELSDTERILDWYTHLGVCPECQQQELGLAELSA